MSFPELIESAGREWRRVTAAVARTREARVFGRVWSDPRHGSGGLPRRIFS